VQFTCRNFNFKKKHVRRILSTVTAIDRYNMVVTDKGPNALKSDCPRVSSAKARNSTCKRTGALWLIVDTCCGSRGETTTSATSRHVISSISTCLQHILDDLHEKAVGMIRWHDALQLQEAGKPGQDALEDNCKVKADSLES
jgi:hypothetical protein